MRIYLPCYAASRLIGFARGVLFAWIIAKGEFGLLQLGLMAMNLLYPLMSLGLNDAVTRYVPYYEARHALRRSLVRAVGLCVGVTTLLGVVSLLFAEQIGPLLFMVSGKASASSIDPAGTYRLMQMIVLTTWLLSGMMLIQATLKGLRMFRAVSLVEVASNALFMLMAILYAWGGWDDAIGMLSSYATALAVIVIVFAVPLWQTIRMQSDVTQTAVEFNGERPHLVGQMFRFSVWLALAAIIWQALHYLPAGFLQKEFGERKTATFTAVRHITQAVLVLSVAVTNVVMPAITKRWESDSRSGADAQLKLIYKAFGLVILAGSAVIVLIDEYVMRMFPAAYLEGLAIFPTMLLFFLICGHLYFLTIHFHLIERTHHLIGAWVAGAAVAWLAGRMWIGHDGFAGGALQAAAMVSLVAIGASLLVTLVLLYVERRPIDLGSLLILLAGFVLLLPEMYVVALLIVFGIIVLLTGAVFSREEKHLLRGQAHEMAGFLRGRSSP